MLPEIIHKILFNVWKIKETPKYTQAQLKQIVKMKTPNLNCGKAISLTFIIASMLPQITHEIKNQGNNMSDTIIIYFDELPFKLT